MGYVHHMFMLIIHLISPIQHHQHTSNCTTVIETISTRITIVVYSQLLEQTMHTPGVISIITASIFIRAH